MSGDFLCLKNYYELMEEIKTIINYSDFDSEYKTDKLISLEKELATLKKMIGNGAGLRAAGQMTFELINDLAAELDPIYKKYNNKLIINNNPLSEASFILSKMHYEKDEKEFGDKFKKLAIIFDPNNNLYVQ